MTRAYNKLYLSNAMEALGDMLDYAVHGRKCDADSFYSQFVTSGVAEQFECGNPKYVGGMSGIELAEEVFLRAGGKAVNAAPLPRESKSAEYWAGWSLAYYQWHSGLSFKEMLDGGLTMSCVLSMYVLHEADISKFVEAANQIIRDNAARRETKLKSIRIANGLSQRELAEKSGVALRMIQLYEQRRNDINKAQGTTLKSLSRALQCDMSDLMEMVIE